MNTAILGWDECKFSSMECFIKDSKLSLVTVYKVAHTNINVPFYFILPLIILHALLKTSSASVLDPCQSSYNSIADSLISYFLCTLKFKYSE